MPVREISLEGDEPPFQVYDTTGPQGHDPREGVPKRCQAWIDDAWIHAGLAEDHIEMGLAVADQDHSDNFPCGCGYSGGAVSLTS